MVWAHHDVTLAYSRELNNAKPDANSIEIMEYMDRLSLGMRALVHEYGFVIVSKLLEDADGPVDPKSLEWDLSIWRDRRQEQLLTDTKIDLAKLAASFERAMAGLNRIRRHAAAY